MERQNARGELPPRGGQAPPRVGGVPPRCATTERMISAARGGAPRRGGGVLVSGESHTEDKHGHTLLMPMRLMTVRLMTMMAIHAAGHDQHGGEWMNSMAISLMAMGSMEMSIMTMLPRAMSTMATSITVMRVMVSSAAAPRRSSAALHHH